MYDELSELQLINFQSLLKIIFTDVAYCWVNCLIMVLQI